ncbi:glycosyltransferase family 8 protein [Paraglaciecola sp. 2405UD69-4]|uniref:glycosyltransferase family 8 protein n=1 Tax=Paraglaciecola sp. 2405UD69-4 TaxID=3391836 RepID=UPI0039C960DB
MEKELHVCACADQMFIKFVPALFESAARFHKSGVVFHLITDELLDKKVKKHIESLIYENNFEIHVIDSSEFSKYKECAHFSKAMYYRYKIPDLLQGIDWALYLDCDMLVRKEITHIFDYANDEFALAACLNPFFTRKNSLELTGSEYFNSGLMLINCNYWRSNNILSKLVLILSEKTDVLEMPDQDALNILFDDKWLKIPAKFNAQTSMFLQPSKAIRENVEYKIALEDPVIVHFSSPNKSWHLSCSSRYRKEYLKLESSITISRRNLFLDLLSRFSSEIRFFLSRLR